MKPDRDFQIIDLYTSGMSFQDIALRQHLPLGLVRRVITDHAGFFWIQKCHKISNQFRRVKLSEQSNAKRNRQLKKIRRQAQGLCVDCGQPVGTPAYWGRGRRPSGYRCEKCNTKRRKTK